MSGCPRLHAGPSTQAAAPERWHLPPGQQGVPRLLRGAAASLHRPGHLPSDAARGPSPFSEAEGCLLTAPVDGCHSTQVAGGGIHADRPPGDTPTWGAAAWTIAESRRGSGLLKAPGGRGRHWGALSPSRHCRPGREIFSGTLRTDWGSMPGRPLLTMGHRGALPPARTPGPAPPRRQGHRRGCEGQRAGPRCCRHVGPGQSPGGDGSTRRHGGGTRGRAHPGARCDF